MRSLSRRQSESKEDTLRNDCLSNGLPQLEYPATVYFPLQHLATSQLGASLWNHYFLLPIFRPHRRYVFHVHEDHPNSEITRNEAKPGGASCYGTRQYDQGTEQPDQDLRDCAHGFHLLLDHQSGQT